MSQSSAWRDKRPVDTCVNDLHCFMAQIVFLNLDQFVFSFCRLTLEVQCCETRRGTGFRHEAISVAVMILLSAAYDHHTNCQAQGLLLHICELGDKHTHTHT